MTQHLEIIGTDGSQVYRVHEWDANGIDHYVDIPVSQVTGIDMQRVVDAVSTQLHASVVLKTAPLGNHTTLQSQVLTIARAQGSRK